MKIIPNAAICYLYYHHPLHAYRIVSSLKLLYNNFLSTWDYPVIILHEGGPANNIKRLQQMFPNIKFIFQEIQFDLDYSKDIIDQIPIKFKGHWDKTAFFSMGYRHMCRLYSGKIFELPIIKAAQYLLRIDSDSYFYDKMKYDPFAVMQEKDYLYASVGEGIDDDYVIEGLYETVKKYQPNNPKIGELKYNGTFHTHFDLTNVQWFIKNYMDYFNYIDKTGNIFIKRWGDAPIKYFGVNLLVPPEKIHMFTDLPYRHGGNYNV